MIPVHPHHPHGGAIPVLEYRTPYPRHVPSLSTSTSELPVVLLMQDTPVIKNEPPVKVCHSMISRLVLSGHGTPPKGKRWKLGDGVLGIVPGMTT